jgi:hypothetical protein
MGGADGYEASQALGCPDAALLALSDVIVSVLRFSWVATFGISCV